MKKTTLRLEKRGGASITSLSTSKVTSCCCPCQTEQLSNNQGELLWSSIPTSTAAGQRCCRQRRRRRRLMATSPTTTALFAILMSFSRQYHYSHYNAYAKKIASSISHRDVSNYHHQQQRFPFRPSTHVFPGQPREQERQRRQLLRRAMQELGGIGDNNTNSNNNSIHRQNNTCKETDSGYLYPGDTLSRGEFLCRGDLRFGIDADRGYFMVGFVNWTELVIIASLNSNDNNITSSGTSVEGEEDIVDGSNEWIDDEKMNDNDDTTTTLWDVITPTSQAWRAIPTSLFTPITQPFSYLNLTEAGNILGYDDEGKEIYDSNYDDFNRLGSKRRNSRLSISSNCWDLTKIDSELGEMCVKLTSPPRAGIPYGTDTWGIRVHPMKIVPVEPVVPPTMAPSTMTPSSVSPTTNTTIATLFPSLPTNSVPSVDLNAAQSPSSMPAYYYSSPSSMTSSTPPSSFSASPTELADTINAPTFHPSHNIIVEDDGNDISSDPLFDEGDGETTHIWGKVWLDSNRNGEIDVGETAVNEFGVKLFECWEEKENEKNERSDNEGKNSMEVTRLNTDSEGMYFLEVPIGKTYQVHFDSNPDEYGFSSGMHTDTDDSGWTECKSTKDGNVRLDAGLYFWNDTSYDEDSAYMYNTASNGMIEESSIGGHIYLDVNENGIMEPVERTAAVGGYTVNNAKMVVSLTNCMTYEVVQTLEKRFPGTYSFGNLTEGSYRLRYEIQALTRANDPNAVSLYSIVDNDGNSSPVYETSCGKLGDGEVIGSGDVGVRSLMDITPYAEEGSPESLAYADAGSSQKSVADAEASTLNLEGEGANSGGGNNAFVPALIGVIVTLSVVVASAALFIKRRYGDFSSFSLLASGKIDTSAIRSVGSNEMGSRAIASGGNDAIETLFVETGSKGDDNIELGIRQLEVTRKTTIDELPEEESVGFEVYDDEDDGLQGSIDYGPVISDMIAKYSQRQGQNNIIDEGSSSNKDHTCSQHHAQHEIQNSSPQRRNFSDNRIIPSNFKAPFSKIDDGSKRQGNLSGFAARDDETSASGSSRSTDPPAASYRDVPAPYVGWNRDIQLVGDIRQYETPHQYVAAPSNENVLKMNHDGNFIEYAPFDSGDSILSSIPVGGNNIGWSGPSPTAELPMVTGDSSHHFGMPYKTSRNRSRRAQSNPRDGQSTKRWRHEAVKPAHSTVEYNAYTSAQRSNNEICAVSVDDDKTAQSSGSDQSSDPPGASYMNLTHSIPVPAPPQRMTPPRNIQPNTSTYPRQVVSNPSPPPRSHP